MNSVEYSEARNLPNYLLNRARKRLLNEYRNIQASPISMIKVGFKEERILEWHFIFCGLYETPFCGGEFHGRLLFSDTFPFSPPSIQFMTPNGRFKTKEDICLILSNFHPEHWKPGYTVSTVLRSVYFFMMCEKTGTVGALPWDEDEIRKCAKASIKFNECDMEFCCIFRESVGNQKCSNMQAISSGDELDLVGKLQAKSKKIQKSRITSSTNQLSNYRRVGYRRLSKWRLSCQSNLLTFNRKLGLKRPRKNIWRNFIRVVSKKRRPRGLFKTDSSIRKTWLLLVRLYIYNMGLIRLQFNNF